MSGRSKRRRRSSKINGTVSGFTRRFAAVSLCVALLAAIDTAYPCGALAGGRASATLTHERAGSVPAELGAGRLSLRLLSSAREQRLERAHPAIAASRAVMARGDHGVRVATAGQPAVSSTPVRARCGRGPPPPALS